MTVKYKRNEGLEVVEIGNELGMLHVDSGNYYIFDEISSEIWSLLENIDTLDQIVSELLKTYDVSVDDCHKDVLKLMNDLIAKKILKEA